MNKHYQIISLDKTIGQLSVKYWTDDYPSGLIYAVDLEPDAEGKLPNAQQLDQIILERFPTGQIEALTARVELVKTFDYTDIEPLVQPLHVVPMGETIPVTVV